MIFTMHQQAARAHLAGPTPHRRAPRTVDALNRGKGVILPQRELTRMVNEVSDEVVGFGPIESLFMVLP